MRFLLLLLLVQASFGLARARASVSEAEAHALLAKGVALSLEAEFEAAREVFDALGAGAPLSPNERVELLSERSLVLFALGSDSDLSDNLRELAELKPDAVLSERAPPALLARWESVALGAREARALATAEPAPSVALTPAPSPLVTQTQDRAPRSNQRRTRALWIGGAVVLAAAAVVTALALTLPSAASGRSAVKPSVEF